MTYAVLAKLGWASDLTAEEIKVIRHVAGDGELGEVSWKTDLSGGIQRVAIAHGCAPFGNGEARASAWNLPDPVPLHREPLYTPRRDLVADCTEVLTGGMTGCVRPKADVGAIVASSQTQTIGGESHAPTFLQAISTRRSQHAVRPAPPDRNWTRHQT